ncbi:MAG: serine hydrolase [Saprospiraceae bacterium]|nr:serine hydrolase [Saprospiraceae bacterium]
MASATPESQGVSVKQSCIIYKLPTQVVWSTTHFVDAAWQSHLKLIGIHFTPDHIHTLYSLSKSFTSTAIGMAVQEGRFKLTSVGHLVFGALACVGIRLSGQAGIRHLLNMASGQLRTPWDRCIAAEGVSR